MSWRLRPRYSEGFLKDGCDLLRCSCTGDLSAFVPLAEFCGSVLVFGDF